MVPLVGSSNCQQARGAVFSERLYQLSGSRNKEQAHISSGHETTSPPTEQAYRTHPLTTPSLQASNHSTFFCNVDDWYKQPLCALALPLVATKDKRLLRSRRSYHERLCYLRSDTQPQQQESDVDRMQKKCVQQEAEALCSYRAVPPPDHPPSRGAGRAAI